MKFLVWLMFLSLWGLVVYGIYKIVNMTMENK
jgi:hypothetical protein